MREWVISVSAIILLSALAELALPDGRMGRTVRGVFALVCLSVLVAPLARVAGGEIGWNDLFSSSAPCEVQESFLDYAREERVREAERACEKALEKNGFAVAAVSLAAADDGNGVFRVTGALVAGAKEEEREGIAAMISEYLGIGIEEVLFDGTLD